MDFGELCDNIRTMQLKILSKLKHCMQVLKSNESNKTTDQGIISLLLQSISPIKTVQR